jgi:hypothetical protein
MYVHRRTLVEVADRFLGVGCSFITSLGTTEPGNPADAGRHPDHLFLSSDEARAASESFLYRPEHEILEVEKR